MLVSYSTTLKHGNCYESVKSLLFFPREALQWIKGAN